MGEGTLTVEAGIAGKVKEPEKAPSNASVLERFKLEKLLPEGVRHDIRAEELHMSREPSDGAVYNLYMKIRRGLGMNGKEVPERLTYDAVRTHYGLNGHCE